MVHSYGEWLTDLKKLFFNEKRQIPFTCFICQSISQYRFDVLRFSVQPMVQHSHFTCCANRYSDWFWIQQPQSLPNFHLTSENISWIRFISTASWCPLTWKCSFRTCVCKMIKTYIIIPRRTTTTRVKSRDVSYWTMRCRNWIDYPLWY